MDDLLLLLSAIWESLVAAVPSAVRETFAAAPQLLLMGAAAASFLCGSLLPVMICVRLLQAMSRGRLLATVSGVLVGTGLLALYALTLASDAWQRGRRAVRSM